MRAPLASVRKKGLEMLSDNFVQQFPLRLLGLMLDGTVSARERGRSRQTRKCSLVFNPTSLVSGRFEL